MDFIKTHMPCDACGSSDALSLNTDGSTKCFACGEFKPNSTITTPMPTPINKPSNYITGTVLPIPQRKLHEDICQRYDYKVSSVNGKPCHVASYRDTEKNIVGQKLRFEDKTFSCIGEVKNFYGQHLFPNGGKKLTITEGELDCLTVAQVLGGGKAMYPVVSLPNGAQNAKTIFQRHLNWLDTFEEVILMFDGDEAGKKGMQESAQILPFGKCKIATLPLKDPSEMLVANRAKELVSAFWDAQVWTPDGIIAGTEIYDRLTNPKVFESVPYPFSGLNEKTRGLRKGEIVTFCAGSGVGKSQICKEIAYHLLKTTDKKIGYIALEESIERTANSIIGLEMNKLLHLEPFPVDDEYNTAYSNTVGSGRFFLYDHWGSLESDNLIAKIRYLCKALEVEYVFLDHISIVVSGMEGGDERRIIDNLMTSLRSLVEETKIGMVLVSHLKRPEGRGHEEGQSTSLAHLRGSASIAQLSDGVVGCERNLQDEETSNITKIRVLKNRFSGETGIACDLGFNPFTGRISETTPPLTISNNETPF